MPTTDSRSFVEAAKRFLSLAGYRSEHIASGYEFSYPIDGTRGHSRIRLDFAGFSSFPHTSRNACIAVADLRTANLRVEALLESLRYFAAPVAIVSTDTAVQLWPVRQRPSDKPLAEAAHEDWLEAFSTRLSELAPSNIAAAKRGQNTLFFVDTELDRWASQANQESLRSILTDALELANAATPGRSRLTRKAENELIHVVFQLFASRVLQDKGVIPATDSAAAALRAAREAYPRCFSASIPANLKEAAAESYDAFRTAYNYQSVNSDMLGYVYENTLVSATSKQQRGIYYTPQSISSYILDCLPIETIPQAQRFVFDPCCGSGSFLLASFARLNSLLPESWSPRQRHDYLQGRLLGGDVDAFAVGIARLSLVLADSTTRDGWEVSQRDALDSWESLPAQPRIVVTNPPFKHLKGGPRSERSTAILKHIIDSIPADSLIGIVLPTSVLDTKTDASTRRFVLEECNVTEIDLFPSSLFESRYETSAWLLKKCGPKSRTTTVMIRELKSADVRRFVSHREFSRTYPANQHEWRAHEDSEFNFSPLSELWGKIASYSLPMHEVSVINTGLQISQGDSERVSQRKRAGDKPFISRMDSLKPFCFLCEHEAKPYLWIKFEPTKLRRTGFVEMYEQPKVLMNATRNPGSAWRMIAAVARKPVYFNDNFHGVRPTTPDWPVEVLAAVLNGHVANAWLDAHSRRRKLIIDTLYDLPFPKITAHDTKRVVELVRQLESAIVAELDDPGGLFYEPLAATAKAADLVESIDSIVFNAYGLTSDERKQVEKFMNIDKRPG